MTALNMAQQNKEQIGKAIGRIASGVHIITLGSGEERDGMMATWIAQAAFEPPMISIAVNKARPILAKLDGGTKLVVNVLGKKNLEIFKHFARPHTEGTDRFAGLNVEQSDFGPVFPEVIGHILCTVVSHTPAGDHVLLVAEVHGGDKQETDDEPMVHIRSSGLHY